MYGSDILCEIPMVPSEMSHKMSYPCIERCVVYWEMKIYELLD